MNVVCLDLTLNEAGERNPGSGLLKLDKVKLSFWFLILFFQKQIFAHTKNEKEKFPPPQKTIKKQTKIVLLFSITIFN